MRSWQIALVTGLVALIALFYQGLWGDPRAIPTVLVGTQAPNISGPDVESDEPFSLDQLPNRVVLINFWASWCLECRQEHANLLAINRRFGDDPTFFMLGINYQDRPDEARNYLKVHGNNFKHVRDLKGAISIDYGVYGVPETFVIDQHGIIRYKYIGPLVGSAYTHLTDNVLVPLLRGQALPVS